MINLCYLGRMPYADALAIQYQLLERRQLDLIDDTLLLVEHPSVLTLGTRGDYSNLYLPEQVLAELGVSIYEVNRGGDITYHGPGQLVGYPIMKIERYPGSIRGFITSLVDGLIKMLADLYGIAATPGQDKYTGVWVGEQKIAAIGLEIKKWVTLHGFALNLNTNLSHFDWINPCGLSKGVTSVAAILGREVDFQAAREAAGLFLATAFGRTPVNRLLADLLTINQETPHD